MMKPEVAEAKNPAEEVKSRVALKTRAPYSPPRLTCFGAVSRYTQGSGGTGTDSATNMTKMCL